MNLTDIKQLLADEEAVSPVIGVILMVAITVILAAVIGTFVLGLGDNVQNEAPQVNFQFQYSGDWAGADTAATVDITHNGGQNVDVATLLVNIGGTEYDPADSGDFSTTWPTTVTTGDTATYTNADGHSSGESVRIIWQAPSGGSSNTIGSSQIP